MELLGIVVLILVTTVCVYLVIDRLCKCSERNHKMEVGIDLMKDATEALKNYQKEKDNG